MGAHHLDTEAIPLARVAGRGALVASTALALTGAGTGLALAHDTGGSGHGADDRDHGSRHASGHDVASSSDARCDPRLADRLTDGLLGDLGLTSSPEELCGAASRGDGQNAAARQQSTDTRSGSGSSDDGSGSAASATPASAAPAAPANPDDVPPAPGETKVIDLPEQPSGHSGRT